MQEMEAMGFDDTEGLTDSEQAEALAIFDTVNDAVQLGDDSNTVSVEDDESEDEDSSYDSVIDGDDSEEADAEDEDEDSDEDVGEDGSDEEDDEEEEEEDDVDINDVGDNDEEDEEELKGYNLKIKGRISREIRLKNDARGQLTRSNAALDLAKQEIERLHNENQQISKAAYGALDRASNHDYENSKRLLGIALEEGDTEATIAAQSEFNKASQARDNIASQKEYFTDEAIANKKPDLSKFTPVEESKPLLTNEAQKWVNNNSSWWNANDARSQEMKEYAASIDGTFGGDPNTRRYFDTMNRMIEARFPDSKTVSSGRPKVVKKKIRKKKSNVAGVSAGGSGRKGSSKNTETVTAEDKASMRMFGLDPTDNATLKRYAKNKKQSNN